MNRSRRWPVQIATCLLAIALWLGATAPESFASSSPSGLKVEQWKVAEIKLTSKKSYADPFKDVEVTAVFVGPDRTVITRPAYWDGGNTWKIRFAPTRPGTWTYRITASDPSDKGLHGQTGKVLSQNTKAIWRFTSTDF